jgi:hypothetical protein
MEYHKTPYKCIPRVSGSGLTSQEPITDYGTKQAEQKKHTACEYNSIAHLNHIIKPQLFFFGDTIVLERLHKVLKLIKG